MVTDCGLMWALVALGSMAEPTTSLPLRAAAEVFGPLEGQSPTHVKRLLSCELSK